MNERTGDLGVVDRWARDAAVSLHRSLTHVPVPSVRTHSRNSWRVPIISIAAAVLLVTGLFVIVERSGNSATTTSPTARRYLVTALPARWKLVSANDANLSPPSPSIPARSYALYATDAAPNGPIFSVEWDTTGGINAVNPGSDLSSLNLYQTTIGNRRAVFADSSTGTRLLYIDLGKDWALIRGQRLTDTQLTSISNGLTADPTGQVTLDPTVIPAGMHRQPGSIFQVLAPSTIGITTSHYVDTTIDTARPNGIPVPSMTLSIETSPSSSPAWLGLLLPNIHPINVASTAGYAFTASSRQPSDISTAVTWTRAGLTFTLVGVAVNETTLLDAAESVRPATATEWSRIIQQSKPNPDAGTADTQLVNTAFPTPQTDPARSGAQPSDVAMTVEVTEPSPTDTNFSGRLPNGTSWTVQAVSVADSLRWTGTFATAELGTLTIDLTKLDRYELNAAGATGIIISAVTTQPDVVSLRVTRSSGDRYTIPLHQLANRPELRIAALVIPNGDLALAELIDTNGTTVQQIK